MSRTALDTSVLIAALQSWHEDHERSLAAVAEALEEPPVIVPHHVLLETYSVLTRMPKPLRLAPRTAVDLLRRTLEGQSVLVQIDAADGFGLLEDLQGREVAGGAVYDALIAEAASAGGASTLLTLNRKHFERVVPEGMTVSAP